MTARIVFKTGPDRKRVVILDPGRSYWIGRMKVLDFTIASKEASRRHCKLEPCPDGGWAVIDQKSSNGTFVNGERVEVRVLADGDVVRIAGATLEFLVGPVPEGERAGLRMADPVLSHERCPPGIHALRGSAPGLVGLTGPPPVPASAPALPKGSGARGARRLLSRLAGRAAAAWQRLRHARAGTATAAPGEEQEGGEHGESGAEEADGRP